MMNRERFFLEIATTLNSSVRSADRYEKLLTVFIQALDCDAACLLRKDGEILKPLSIHGLAPEVFYRCFAIKDHPRLAMIAEAEAPVVFPHRSPLPDPFDGLLEIDATASLDVHSCLGCPLIVEGEIIGVLTADALQAHKFDAVDRDLIMMLAALAGATLRTSLLIEELEQKVEAQKFQAPTTIHDSARDGRLIGESIAMDRVRATIEMVGPTDLSILINGETGTGKELVARHLHQRSLRRSKPLVYVNCAALPESLAESELFGHRKGAFTGASSDRLGKFELADGGTIFLDEIGELPLAIQPKLLRVLQEGELQRVGSDQMKRVNVRVLAATNRDLQLQIEQGRFRADLFHRLNAYPIAISPLRERPEDIPLLAAYFCETLQRKLGTAPVRLDSSAKDALKRAVWHGNVREMKNVLARAILNAHHRQGAARVLLLTSLDVEFLLTPVEAGVASQAYVDASLPASTLKEATQTFQRNLILSRLREHKNNWAQTAKSLGLDRSNLHHLAKRLELH